MTHNEIIQYCLTDSIHWKHAIAATVITAALEELSIRYPIKQSSLSPYWQTVQKASPHGCYKLRQDGFPQHAMNLFSFLPSSFLLLS